MSYPPPPGLNGSNTTNTSKSSSSLPPRPPPSSGSKSSFNNNNRSYGGNNSSSGSGYSSFTSFAPRSVAAQQPARNNTQSPPTVAVGPQAPSGGYSAGPQAYGGGGYNQQQPYQQSSGPAYYPQQSGYGQEAYTPAAPPQIKNPFAPPGQAGRFGPAADPELEAQIAQWQSAYVTKEEKKAMGGGTGVRVDAPAMSNSEITSAANTDSGVANVVTGADGKQKTVVRSGGGQSWQDTSLLEWDPSHFRLFVGNLAGEVTDESLMKAFSKYASIEKARVIREKRTTKSKGYGFVSFRDGDDYFQAAREMQGKYIGSHPILLRKSTTEIKAVTPKDKKNRGGKNGKGGNYRENANTGAGIQKKQKTKGGLKILG